MTQDAGMMEGNGQPVSSFWRGAMHILGGAAAASTARNAGEAIYRGAQVGNALQNSYIKDQQFRYGLQRQSQMDQMKAQQHEMDLKLKQKRLDQYETDKADDSFMRKLQMIDSLTAPTAMQNKRATMSRLTARQPTDGSLTYPIDQPRAERIIESTQSPQKLAKLKGLIFAFTESRNGSKAAQEYVDILGPELGISVEKTKDGTEYIKDKYLGTFPLDYESAHKIFERRKAMLESEESQLADMHRMRHLPAQGAMLHLDKRINELKLNIENPDKSRFLSQYAQEISNNPVQSALLDLAHPMDRLVKGKDGEMSKMEMQELANKFKKAGIKHNYDAETNEHFIDGKAFNDAINRFNPNERFSLLPEGQMVKVDDKLIATMFEDSGLNNLRDKYLSDMKQISDINDQNNANFLQSKLQAKKRDLMMSEEAKVYGDELAADSKERIKLRDIKAGKYSKYSFDEIAENVSFKVDDKEFRLRDNPQILDVIENRATAELYKARSKNTEFKEMAKDFKNSYGIDLKDAIKDASIPDVNGEAPVQDEAFDFMKSWLRQNSDLSKTFESKFFENAKKRMLRSFLKNPGENLKAMQAINNFNNAQHAINAQRQKYNQAGFKNKKDKLSHWIKDAKSNSPIVEKDQPVKVNKKVQQKKAPHSIFDPIPMK